MTGSAGRAGFRGRRAIAATIGAVAACLALAVAAAGAATRLDYRGAVLSNAQVQALVQPWLRTPGDSAAANGALTRLTARLQELGYLDARVRAERDTVGDRLLLRVAEGRRYRLRSVALQAGSGPDSAEALRALRLAPGGAVAPAAIGEAIAAATQKLSDEGHPYAEMQVTRWQADSTGAVDLALAAELGPKVVIEAVRFEGLKSTRPEFAKRAMGALTGQPYRRANAEAARDRLVQLGLFRDVAWEGIEAGATPALGRLVYRVDEPKFNRFEGALGVQGQAGTVGLANLELGNLGGTGRSLGLKWESRGKGVADFDASYREPLVFGLPLKLEARVAQQVQDTLYTRSRWGGSAGYALSAQERLEVGVEGERVVQATGPLENAWLQHTLFALERSTLDNPLAPRRGTRARIAADQIFKRERLRTPATQTARASAVEGHFEIDQPLRGSTGLSIEAAAAGRFSSQRVLPIFERYPLGGATTLRGFDEEAFRVDRYVLTRTEWRFFLGAGQRAGLFWDHAWTQTRESLPAGGDRLTLASHDGVGFGLRLAAAGGIVGVDYGLEPGRGALEGKIHLQVVSTF